MLVRESTMVHVAIYWDVVSPLSLAQCYTPTSTTCVSRLLYRATPPLSRPHTSPGHMRRHGATIRTTIAHLALNAAHFILHLSQYPLRPCVHLSTSEESTWVPFCNSFSIETSTLMTLTNFGLSQFYVDTYK